MARNLPRRLYPAGKKPEPTLIPSTPETTEEPTHPNLLSPDPMHEPEDISNHPEAQTDDPSLHIDYEPEDAAPPLNFPGNQSTIFDETQPQIGSQISPTTTL